MNAIAESLTHAMRQLPPGHLREIFSIVAAVLSGVMGLQNHRAARRIKQDFLAQVEKLPADEVIQQLVEETLRALNNHTLEPKRARFIIQLLMPNHSGDEFLDDLGERFNTIIKEHGLAKARFWYWFQVIISLRPIVGAILMRITGLSVAYEAIRKTIH